MTKKERWITSIAFAVSAFPVIFMAFMLKILPNHIPIIDFNTPSTNEYFSKYNNLITAVFYLIPLAVVLIARYIKRKLKDFGNYIAVQCVSIVLSVSFTVIAMMGFLEQIEAAPELKSLDLYGIAAVGTSVVLALCGNFTRYRKYNSKLAINNRFTRSSPSVWRAVHRAIGTLQVIAFVILSIVLAFISGWIALLFLGIAIAGFCTGVQAYSYSIMLIFNSRRTGQIE